MINMLVLSRMRVELLVSLQPRAWSEVPELTAQVARAAFPKGCLAMNVRDRLGPLFDDEVFRSAFGVRGRPGISPGQLALVSVLQFAENLTDRQAAHAVRSRIDWKYLLGLELSHTGFDFTVLTGFRDRLLAHDLEETVLDMLLGRLTELGLVVGRGRQRTDSTHVLAAVRSLNRLEFVGETLRAALEALAAASPEWLGGWMEPVWRQRYGVRTDAYRLPRAEDERAAQARQIGDDGYRLLEAVFSPAAPTWLREIPAVEILRAVWLQQYHRVGDGDEQTASLRGKDDLPPSRDRITSPYDTDSRYGMKRGMGWDGYKVHLSETCDDTAETGRPHLITDVLTTDATVNDAVVLDQIHNRLRDKDLLPAEHLVDAGYTSAELLLESQAEHGVAVVGPVRSNTTRQANGHKDFSTEAFEIDWSGKQATCPTGATSKYWTEGFDSGKRPAIRIRFATGTCAPCPVRDQCTSSHRYGRQLTIRPQEQNVLLERVRAKQATEEWKQRYATRAGVEGTIHQAVAVTGVRRSRYTSLAKTHLAHIFTAAAVNLIRLDAWWNGTPLAPTRISYVAGLDLPHAA
ncbi:Transposase, IS4 family [Saccharothrix espanaensis DSM 44229]|uniref:Transposase, IS4 family n=2 Tax=Saccharothrix espanaensis (strain ATCC 51144 / DSM 44229 / JCM 9112 / NBRC 15066 / NRRL 15764) TaxID=1179773 RepID=K0K276_SACES|nr:Transposase, IS4 family [Saccharothrix espanaensis DSM 44229]